MRYYFIITTIVWLFACGIATEDECTNKLCAMYPDAICLVSDTGSNSTTFMDNNGYLIQNTDCDCSKNHKLYNTQCLDHYVNKSIGKYYINIDITFNIRHQAPYQNQRDVLFSSIRECISFFLEKVTSLNQSSIENIYITSYSYSNSENDNELLFEDIDDNVSSFHFIVQIYEHVTNLTSIINSSNSYMLDVFNECNLMIQNISNLAISVQLLETEDKNVIGVWHLFGFSGACFTALLFLKKSIFLPVTKFWCNFCSCWSCNSPPHCCCDFYCCQWYNKCGGCDPMGCCDCGPTLTSHGNDCGASCFGFGCGCWNGCKNGCILRFCTCACGCCGANTTQV